MKTLFKSLIGAGLVCAAGSVVAQDNIILTSDASKSGRNFVSLDLASDGATGAFSFVVDLPKDATNVDTKSCLAELPKSHQGECRVVKGNRLAVIAFSLQNAPLSAGVVALGSVSFDSHAKAVLTAREVTLAKPAGADRAAAGRDSGSSQEK